MENTITLRNAGTDDYEFLYDLNFKAMFDYVEATWGWDDTWQQNYFRENFQPENTQIILLNAYAVGRVELHHQANELRVGNIQILPQYQNKGIGKIIMSRIIQQARQKQQFVTLQVLKVNPARRFYERLGFYVEDENEFYFKMKLGDSVTH